MKNQPIGWLSIQEAEGREGEEMKATECSNCGAAARVVRGTYDLKEVGLKNVVLQGIKIVKCLKCKNEDPIIANMNGLMRALALAVTEKPYRLTGEEVRFLRKYLRLTGEEFSRLIHVDKTTLSKWENNEDRVGDQSDRLIRLVALGLGQGLKKESERVIRSFPQIRGRPHPVGIQMNATTLSYQYG
jgi:putative zinc finger/helix-turn-helix YgiT family protein